MEMQIEEVVKVVRQLTHNLRTNMTPVTRYVKHEREDHPQLTAGKFIDRHLKYKQMALVSVENILKCLNDNKNLRQVENMRFDTEGNEKQTEGGWISVEERLPEKDYYDYVLAWDGRYVNFLHYNHRYQKWDDFATMKTHPWKVTHWMPLPEAPKGEHHDS